MERKHKRLTDTIMKPEDLKKARIQKSGVVAGSSTSSTSSGGIKAKLDFRSATAVAPKANQHMNSTAGPSIQSSHTVRPVLDEKWKEFGDTINLNLETFAKSVKEAVEQDKFNKVARMLVAALKSFLVGDKLKVEFRLVGTIAETIKNHGSKLNHVPLHRGLLFMLSHSRSYPDNILQLFVSLTTSLAKQQTQPLDKSYIAAFLHDAIGMNVGLGTANRCAWIEKAYSEALVSLIMSPFATVFPDPEMYAASQVEGFVMSDYIPKQRLSTSANEEQLAVYLEFLKPWFENIRGEVLPKPLFRALCLLCGSDHVRFFVVSRLDVWITLQKFHREISELLLVLGCNIDTSKDLDKDLIDILLKLNTKNMKTRTISGPYNVAIRKACEQSTNVQTVFESLIVNETGAPQNRSPANLPTMFMLLACHPTEATRALALVCAKELIRERETSTKMLRSFLRELIRGFNHMKSGEFPFSVFVHTLLNAVSKKGEPDELTIMAVELVSQIPLATITSLLVTRENAFASKYNNPTASGDFPLIPPEARLTREKFQTEFVLYCETVLEWLSKSRPVFPDESSFIRSFYLLLYLEKQRDVYTSIEMAAVSDQEIGNCFRIFGECGVSEKMLLLLSGEKNSRRLASKNTVELASALTQRAVLYHPKYLDAPLVKLTDPFKLIDRFLETTILSENEVARFEELPVLCSRSLYWNAWNTIVLWLAGGQIVEFLPQIYESYPIVRYLVFCIMTKRFEFPLDFEGKTSLALHEEEASAVAAELKIVNLYEKKMSRPVNSLSAVACLFPEKKYFRAPLLLDELRLFAEKFKLASRFSRCESPPLLSKLVADIGAENSLFAVREMLTADSTSASMLSAECVFHAIMYYFDNQRVRDTDQTTSVAVKALVRQAESNFKSSEPIEQDFLLQAFINSLASPSISTRSAVVNVFSRLFPSSEDKAFDLAKLASVPRFESGKLKYLEKLAGAVLVESDSVLANAYIQFLTRNSVDRQHIHTLARAVCQIMSVDCVSLQTSLCEYFLQYVELCAEHQQADGSKPIDASLSCVEFGSNRVAISREVPVAVVKLLSKYSPSVETSTNDIPFDALVELWLSPGAIPKLIDPDTGASSQFLSLAMRKEMLKSAEQRVVDAALDELSETDAQQFVLVSQMSTQTAEKVIAKAENMKVEGIEKASLTNMYLLIRGYRMKGIKAGEQLVDRLKAEIDRLDAIVTKEEPMEVEVDERVWQRPLSFIDPNERRGTTFADLDKVARMTTNEITAWLKKHCSVVVGGAVQVVAKQQEQSSFRLPPAFIQSAMNDEKSALTCLQHIEANLKFFLSHESAFQTLIVIIDSAANKFEFVRKRLENLAVRLLKSVSPPLSVAGVLQKHASNNRAGKPRAKPTPLSATTFADLSTAMKGVSTEREKQTLDQFMASFVEDKGEVIEPDDVVLFIRSLRSVYSGGSAETTAERCLSNRWTPHLQKVVCASLLENYREHVCSVFVFRLLCAYCKRFPIASYSELFMVRDETARLVLHKKAFQVLVIYFADVATKNEEYDLRIVNLIAAIEKQGGVQSGFQFGRALLQTSCANPKPQFRKTAKRLLEAVADRLTYLSYKNGVASSIRVLTNVESRESCIRRCEQIVDRIVEMPMDPKLALAEDICEEERPTAKEAKEDEPAKLANGSKRPMDRAGRNGPPVKKSRFISARDLPIPMIGGGGQTGGNEETVQEEPSKREWIATAHAMTRFDSLLREHPNVVKMKFPVLANFVARLTQMGRKDLKDENRLRKVELILQAVIVLCPTMKPEEMSSIDTALSNCFEFYDKFHEEAHFGMKEQAEFAELTVRACAMYLNHSFAEARTLLRDNRALLERICKRSGDPFNVDLVLENCKPPPV